MPYTIALAVAEFNRNITREMEERAKRRVEELGHKVGPVVTCSGSWDLPWLVDQLLRFEEVDACVALGCIVTGETKHDEVIGHAATQKLMDVALDNDKPVGLGVTGPGQTWDAAEARVDRADAAVDAVVKLLDGVERALTEAW